MRQGGLGDQTASKEAGGFGFGYKISDLFLRIWAVRPSGMGPRRVAGGMC